jgi:hypothetical protein
MGGMRSHTAGRVRLLIFFGCFVIFSASPVTVLLDSQFALLTSEGLLKNRTPALNRFEIPGLDPAKLPARRGLPQPGKFYQLVRVHGRVLYAYPHGSSFLSLPFVAVLDALGVSTLRNSRTYDFGAEALLEKLLASLLMAAAAGVFFEIGMRARLPIIWSAVVAIGGALGTPIWSSASRTLWSQTWEVLLGSGVVLLLLQADHRRARPIWFATLLAWMYFVRPTAAVAIAFVTLYFCLCERRRAATYLIVLTAWMLVFVLYWILVFGQALPDYYRLGSLLDLTDAAATLPAILISPSRGLLVFMPTAAMVLYLVARYWKVIDRRLAALALAIICGNLLLVASYPTWWGGWSYGPRLLTGTIPWFVLLGAMGCRCAAADPRRSPVVLRAGLALMLLAIAINGWGAVSWTAALWGKEVGINARPEVVWDWRHPQFLAGL